MKAIAINNFGAVKKVNVQMDKSMQVFIGPQASGKSTIGKVIYFLRKIRDYTFEFLLDADQFSTNHPNEYFSNYLKYFLLHHRSYVPFRHELKLYHSHY